MKTAGAKVRKSAGEVRHLHIGALPVSEARVLRVLYESKKKLSIDKIVVGICVRFKHKYTTDKVRALCSEPSLSRLLASPSRSHPEGYGLNKVGKKLVECALRSFAMHPIQYADYTKFERTSTSPNVGSEERPNVVTQKSVPTHEMRPTHAHTREFEQQDCV